MNYKSLVLRATQRNSGYRLACFLYFNPSVDLLTLLLIPLPFPTFQPVKI